MAVLVAAGMALAVCLTLASGPVLAVWWALSRRRRQV